MFPVEILQTEIVGNKLKAELNHLSYVLTMKNTAPVFHTLKADQTLESVGAIVDDETGSMVLTITAGDDDQMLSLNGIFTDSDVPLGDQINYVITSDNSELVDAFTVVESGMTQLVLDITEDKSREGLAKISVFAEDTNGLSTEPMIFYADVASVSPDYWRVEIDLQSGLNLVSLPLQPIDRMSEIEQWTAADLADKISATVIVSMDNGEFVPFIPQVMQDSEGNYLDEGFDIEGGKGYIINVLDDHPIVLNGKPWEQSIGSEPISQPGGIATEESSNQVNRAPSKLSAPWTFVISGDLVTDAALSFGFDLSQVACVLAVNSETGHELTGQVKGNRFYFVMTDLTMRPVVVDGQSFEIRAEDVDGNLIAGPISWQLDTDHLRQAYIHQQLTVGDIIPNQTRLLPNYPNPFNPETWIPFELEQSSNVQLTIFDSQGNIIRQLDLGHQTAGRYLSKNRAAYWDGCNQLGEPVSSGIYFYTFVAESERSKWLPQTRKMVILK